MSFDSDLLACAALVEKADPDRFSAVMASPLPARRVLFPLYAFNVEVSRAPWVTQETMIAEMRLQWWRDALEEIAQGKPVRRHEVTQPLAGFIDAQGAEILDRLVAARRWDIYKEPFEDSAHFDSYLDDTAAGLMWVAARALGVAEEQEESVRSLGRATGLARFLRAVPALEEHQRVPLVDGRPEAISALATKALAGLDPLRLRRAIPAPARPALTEAFLTHPLLSQAARAPQDVARGALAVHPLKRSLLLWRWS